MPPVSAYFLTDGGQDADSVALRLCDFLAAAKRSLEIAIYDLRLEGSAQQRLVDAVRAATSRGVDVRLIFNVDHQKAVPIPPPPKIDFDLIHALGVHFRPISGVPDLMHHKYVVRDRASVLTGSTNWTTDSWTREENVLVEVESPELAAMYLANFEELWTTRDVSASGKGGTSWVEPPGLADGRIRPFFTPGGAHRLVHEIAHCIATTTRRLRICSPVITSGPILGTLGEVVLRPGLDLKGVYDATQMHSVIAQWGGGVSSGWKVAAFESVVN
ncbi:MAG TPA: phospholipase D family protein, partial [Candidatus Dormibacteraeota bacterium]|nr:phospholipase D family protein [Candidatus Dormibacteraeota bacterium]